MIHDAPDRAPVLRERFDVCIAGAGVAGIVMARGLAARGLRVLLLEGGARELSETSQDLYRGRNVGHDYIDLAACRLRFLGGTSNHWSGWCRPLDAEDFAVRPHIPHSGWPIGRSDLDPFLQEACGIVEVPAFGPDRVLDGSDGRLREVVKHRSPPVRFGAKYRGMLESSDAIQLVLNANLVDIRLGEDGARVDGFVVAGVDPAAPRRTVVADRYVLALGGLENARILLNADQQVRGGIGNASGFVGRYFMDHPHFDVGYYVLGSTPSGFGDQERFVSLSHRAMSQTASAAVHYQLKPVVAHDDDGAWQTTKDTVKGALCSAGIVQDFMQTTGVVDCSTVVGAGRLRVGAEQVPNPRSQARLGAERDRYGLRRLELDWQLLPQDWHTVRTGALELAAHFARQDLGRVKLFDWVLDGERTSIPGWDTLDSMAGNHHIGTTRMGFSARDGVVDRDCRVFGTDNLYVAGSGVFRTCGFANPTLSIVQLALRLANHLGGAASRG